MSFLASLLLTRPEVAQLMATEYSAVASIPADTSEGSVLGSVFNAKALLSVGVLQPQVVYIASIIRLATIPALASGAPNPDVDSFVNAFGVYRQQASNSTGQATFSCSSAPLQSILIPAVAPGSTGGVIVQTASGIQFQVITDATNSAYNASLQGYVIAAGTTSVTVTVECTSDGTQGNIAAGQITGTPLSGPGVTTVAGVASVTNASSFNNATPVESDIALKERFATQWAGPSGNSAGVTSAILGTQINLTYSIGNNLNAAGATQNGYFTVVVNNSGTNTSPSSTLLTAVSNAVATAYPLGTSYQVIAPTLVTMATVANIKLAQGYAAQSTAVLAACTAALTAYNNGIGLSPTGAPTACTIFKTYATLAGVEGVADVTGLTLNAGAVDVSAAFAHQIVFGSATLTPYS